MKVSELSDAQRRKIAYGVFAPAALAAIFSVIMLVLYARDGSTETDSAIKGRKVPKFDESTTRIIYLTPVGIAVVYGLFKLVTGLSAMRHGVCVPGSVSKTGIALAGGNRNVWVSYEYQGKSYGLKTSNPALITDAYEDDKQMIVVIKPGNPRKGIPVWSDWPEQ